MANVHQEQKKNSTTVYQAEFKLRPDRTNMQIQNWVPTQEEPQAALDQFPSSLPFHVSEGAPQVELGTGEVFVSHDKRSETHVIPAAGICLWKTEGPAVHVEKR